MLNAIAALLVCQLLGEVMARGLSLPVPGPVLGLAILFTALIWRGRNRPEAESSAAPTAALGRTADQILAILGLLFVPAGVGVVDHLDLFARHGLALAAALVISVVLTLLVTVGAFLGVTRLIAGPKIPGASDD